MVSQQAGVGATHAPATLPASVHLDESPGARTGIDTGAGSMDDLPEPLRQRVLLSPGPGEADPWQLWLEAKETLAQEVLQVVQTRSRLLVYSPYYMSHCIGPERLQC